MHIGILQTGHVPEAMVSAVGDYDGMFAKLLGGEGFRFTTWAVVDGLLPSKATEADGWLITGSRHGAYEDLPWIPPLEDLIREAFDAKVPMVGICFGHQIVAQALGGRVEKFQGGWIAGRQTYAWDGAAVSMMAWHQDQVTHPPEGATTVASGPGCEHAVLVYPDRALTIQAHPEFERDFIEGLITHRGPAVMSAEELERTASRLSGNIDRSPVAGRIAQFFKEHRP